MFDLILDSVDDFHTVEERRLHRIFCGLTFWLHRFRKLDVRQKSHRKMLIDTFVNAIFLYDDKIVITFNYKDGTDTITFDDLKAALDKEKTGSDLDCSTAPRRSKVRFAPAFLCQRQKRTSSVIFRDFVDFVKMGHPP